MKKYNYESLAKLIMQMDLPTLTRFIQAVTNFSCAPAHVIKYCSKCNDCWEAYIKQFLEGKR